MDAHQPLPRRFSAKTPLAIFAAGILVLCWMLLRPSAAALEKVPPPPMGASVAEPPRGSRSRDAEAAVVRAAVRRERADADLRGRAVDSKGAPIEGVQLVLSAADGRRWQVDSDAKGRLSLDALPANCSLGVALRFGERTWSEPAEPLVLAGGDTHEAEWTLHLQCVLHGVARDAAGNALVGERIQLIVPRAESGPAHAFVANPRKSRILASAITDAHGAFRLPPVQPGRYLLGPEGPSSRTFKAADGMTVFGRVPASERVSPYYRRIEILPNTAEQRADVRAWRGLLVRGHLLYPDGEPVVGASLHLYRKGCRGWMGERTGEDGSFTIEGLVPGSYSFYCSTRDGWFLPRTAPVEAGTSGHRLVLVRAGGVSGTLVRPSAAAAAKGWIHVLGDQHSGKPGAGLAMGPTADSDFAFDGVVPGTYHVRFASLDGRWYGLTPNVPVVAGETHENVRVEIAPAARLRLRNPAKATVRVKVHWGQYLFESRTLHAGASSTVTVPPGKLRVCMTCASTRDEIEAEIEIAAREQGEVSYRTGAGQGR